MKLSPSLIGKIVGAIAVVAICIPLFMWSKANYTIKGRVQVDTGAYISPARNVDVKLILGSVEDELKMLVDEYDSYRDFRKNKAIESILERKKDIPTNSQEKAKVEAPKDVIKKMLSAAEEKSDKTGKIKIDLAKLDDKEREQVTSLVSKYYQNSNVCRDEAAACPIGAIFYEKGSLFWEKKADNLVENKRIIFDEITTNYVTTWVEGGLGGEPIQVVKTVIVTNITIQEIKEALGKTPDEKPAEEKKDGKEEVKKVDAQAVLADYNFSTNEVLDAAVELKRDLQQKYRSILQKSDDLLIEMIIDQVTTDENGNFIFKGKAVKQGKFFVASQYDILSSEGERVEFSWFHPVNISLKRLTFNKSTTVNLDELNQSKPPVNNIYVPSTEELVLDILDGLKEKIESEKAAAETNVLAKAVFVPTNSPAEVSVNVSLNETESISETSKTNNQDVATENE